MKRFISYFRLVVAMALSIVMLAACVKPGGKGSGGDVSLVITSPGDSYVGSCAVAFYSRSSGRLVSSYNREMTDGVVTLDASPSEDCNVYVLGNVSFFNWPSMESELDGKTVVNDPFSGVIPRTSSSPVVFHAGDSRLDVNLDKPLFVRCIVPLRSSEGSLFQPVSVTLDSSYGANAGFSGMYPSSGSSGGKGSDIPFVVKDDKMMFYIPAGIDSDVTIAGNWNSVGSSMVSGDDGMEDNLSLHIPAEAVDNYSSSKVTEYMEPVISDTGVSGIKAEVGTYDSEYERYSRVKRTRGKVAVITTFFDHLCYDWKLDIYDVNGDLYDHLEYRPGSSSMSAENVTKEDLAKFNENKNVYDDFPSDVTFKFVGAVSKLPYNRMFAFLQRVSYEDYGDELGTRINAQIFSERENQENDTDGYGKPISELEWDEMMQVDYTAKFTLNMKDIQQGSIFFLYEYLKILPYEYSFSADNSMNEYCSDFKISIFDGNDDSKKLGEINRKHPMFVYATDKSWEGKMHLELDMEAESDYDDAYVNVYTADGRYDKKEFKSSYSIDETFECDDYEGYDVQFFAKMRYISDDTPYLFESVDFIKLPGTWYTSDNFEIVFSELTKMEKTEKQLEQDPSDMYKCTLTCSGNHPSLGYVFAEFACTLSKERMVSLIENKEDTSQQGQSFIMRIEKFHDGLMYMKMVSSNVPEGEIGWFPWKLYLNRNK